MHIQDTESRQLQNVERQTPVESEYKQDIRAIASEHTAEAARTARQKQIRARRKIRH